MKYLSAKEVSIKWNIDQSLVLRLLKSGRVDGAIKIGNNWAIPDTASKPIDKRTKKSRIINDESFFRFLLYINLDDDSYNPPLTNEEKQLRDIQNYFHIANFNIAEDKAIALLNKSKNRYIITTCLYYLVSIYYYQNNDNLKQYLFEFNAALSQNYKYKKEMILLKYFMDIMNNDYKSTIEHFCIDNNYEYDKSYCYLMYVISFVAITNGKFEIVNKLRYETYELLSIQMENESHYLEAQCMHFLLLVVYQTFNNVDKMQYHARKAIDIAYKHNLYLYAGLHQQLYSKTIDEILKDYPTEFSNKIIEIGNYINKSEKVKALTNNDTSYIGVLDEDDYELAFIVNQGYTYKEIANKLSMPEKAVYKKYSEIYDKLGIKTRQELIDIINKTHFNNESK